MSKTNSNTGKSHYNANTYTVSQNNHHSNQYNPNNAAYTANQNNHSNQCNPNNVAYQSSRVGKK